ncbi:uncharacterized protein [Diadema antillarum]|uniref:uncharacterized protein n=1 Tax=Diadema antillarum TaxID=105358 RepID=UPI003A89F496
MALLNLHTKLSLLSTICLVVAVLLAREASLAESVRIARIIFGLIAVVAFCLSLLFLSLLALGPAPNDGIKSILRCFLSSTVALLQGKIALYRLEKHWRNPRRAQDRLLRHILLENGDTEYGRRYRLRDIKDREEFRARHPLTTYEHYRPFVEREMNGERNVMTRKFHSSYVSTSGTTGRSKMIPQTDRLKIIIDYLDLLYAIVRMKFPHTGIVQKQLFVYIAPVVSRTKNGGLVESALTIGDDTRLYYTTPPAGFRINSYEVANYIHLLFALRDRNIGSICVFFLSTLESMMKQLEQWWEDIVHDIEYGTISERLDLPDDVRSALTSELRDGDRQRALELRQHFVVGLDNIFPRVWPKLRVILSVDSTGIWPQIREKYARGITLVSSGYGCSEGLVMGISIWAWDEQQDLLFFPTINFFEFIRLQNTHESQPETLFLDELEIGQEYEVVITQACGLYRYRLGDIIRVTGFHDNCPSFQFLYRLGLMLNLRYEKIDQGVALQAIQAAVKRWPDRVKLTEFAAAESTLLSETCTAFERNEIMPYYLLFVELEFTSGNESCEEITQEHKALLDRELRDRNSDYDRLRREGAIAPPRVHIVKPGAFEALKAHILANTSTTANQYKVPRKLRTESLVEFLLHQVM